MISKNNIAIRIIVLACLAFAAFPAGHAPLLTSQTSTPTYVLGVANSTDPLIVDLQNLTSSVTILSGVSGLSLLRPNSILFIDGTWLQSAASLDPAVLPLVIGTMLNGVPTIVARGNPAIVQDSTSGLLNIKAPSLPLITDGVNVIGTLPDGTRQGSVLQVVSGFNYAIKTEFNWAQQQLVSPIIPTMSPTAIWMAATSSDAPQWQFVLRSTTDTGTSFAPVAKITSTFTIFQLQNSGSTAYKWYNFFANQTLQPGVKFYENGDFSGDSGSGWRNLSEQDTVQVNKATNMIVSHGPTAQNIGSSTTVKYTIGVTNGTLGAMVTANQTRSYVLRNTSITDSVQPFQVGWLHSFDPNTRAGDGTLMIIPGLTDRFAANKSVDLSVTCTSTFAQLNDYGAITQTRATSIQFIVT